MSIGPDIKEVIAEVGMPITILRAVNITGEFIKIKLNAQVTKPFIREFFVEATLSYDTQVAAGDVLELSDGRRFLVMNKSPVLFEGNIYQFSTVLYKCNTAGTIVRMGITKVNYKSVAGWSVIRSNAYALLTENQYGNELKEDGDIGNVSVKVVDCYMPRSYLAKVGDRFEVSADEYYQIEDIKIRRYDNVDLITLGEDTRGARA